VSHSYDLDGEDTHCCDWHQTLFALAMQIGRLEDVVGDWLQVNEADPDREGLVVATFELFQQVELLERLLVHAVARDEQAPAWRQLQPVECLYYTLGRLRFILASAERAGPMSKLLTTEVAHVIARHVRTAIDRLATVVQRFVAADATADANAAPPSINPCTAHA